MDKKVSFRKIAALTLMLLGAGLTACSLYNIHQGKEKVKEQLVSVQQEISAEKSEEAIVEKEPEDAGKSRPANQEKDLPLLLYPTRPSAGERIGTLTLPKLNKVLPIVHGTDPDQLDKGVGHYAKSVLPGEQDNSVLSGHRDTVFRQLGLVKEKDMLIVETSAGVFTYQVRKVRIVDKDDKSVIVPTDHAVLTVTTCYPFDYIGDAPERYILIADLIESEFK
jgi:sortase A